MKDRGLSELLSILVLTGIIVGIGIMVWGLCSGYAAVERMKSHQELNKNILVLRSMISADYVMYPGGVAILRNIGKEPVVIIRLITIRNGRVVWDSGIGYWGELEVGETGRFSFSCPGCGNDDIVTLQVHYMPSELFDPANPTLIDPTTETILFRVASFTSEKAKSPSGAWCVTPAGNWSWIDLVDPFEAGEPAGTLTKWLKLRLPKDSIEEREYYETITIKIKTISEDKQRIATATVMSENETDQWVDANFQNLKYPITIEVTAETPGWTIVQKEWYFDAIYRHSWWWGSKVSSYVDLVKLFWDTFNYRVYQVFAKVYHDQDGVYRVTARLICKTGSSSIVVGEGSLTREVDVPQGGAAYEDYVINIEPHPSMFSFNRVEVYVEKIS